MARYIDIENNEKIVNVMYGLFHFCNLKHKEGCFEPDCKECIKSFFSEQLSNLLPTADVMEVKHGAWVEHYAFDCWHYDCPFCDDGYATKEKDKTPPNYCPNCGAYMGGKAQEEVKCKDCEYLMYSDCYGECSKVYKGIVSPDYSCGKGKRRTKKDR